MAAPLIKNLSYLSASQAANYILPLVTLPYITRVVGPENFGLVEFATVVMLYFVVLVDYSFLTTATRKIAQAGNNVQKTQEIASAVLQAKLLLMLVAFAIFAILVAFLPKFKENSYLLWMSMPIVLGFALYPNFLYHGTQKIAFIAIANVLIKTIAALLIFVFLQREDQFYRVTFINGLSQVGVGIVALWYVKRALPGFKWRISPWHTVRELVWEGRFVFISNLFTRVYGFGSLLIGGFLLSPVQLGMYAAAAKLVTVAQSFIFQPLQGALFPHLNQKATEGFVALAATIKKNLKVLFVACLISSVMLWLLADLAINILFGSHYAEAATLVKIMAPLLVVGSFGHMYLSQGLLILRQDKYYMSIIIMAGILSIGLNIWLIPIMGVYGAAWVKLAIEVFVALAAAWAYFSTLKRLRNA